MDRLETAAWQLAGGALCAFVLAVVLKEADWRIGCAVVAVSVAGWSLAAPPAAGAVLGLVGWLLVTGFDVVKDGNLTLAGTPDLIRLGGLVAVGLTGSLIGRWTAVCRDRSPADLPADPGRPAWHEGGVRDEDVRPGAVEDVPGAPVGGRGGSVHAVRIGTWRDGRS